MVFMYSVNVHAQTNKKMEEIKEEFYNLLQQNINQIARSDIKIILRDFNTKVGKASIYKPTIVRSTTFLHKHIHKET